MIILLVVIWLTSSADSFGESFQLKLAQKRTEVEQAIGKKKLRAIEIAGNEIRIHRITQLLTIDSIGQTTVIKLNKILGTRFNYDFNEQVYLNKRSR